MKKAIVEFIFVAIICTFILGLCSHIESTYTKECKVVSVEGNVITFEDEERNFWEWEKEEKEKEYFVNESVKLVMYDNYTLDCEDDEIRKVKRGV